jgi:hypothetical protein
MAFTKQHYIAISRIIRNASAQVGTFSDDLHTGSTQQIDKAQLVSDLSELFRQDNPRFDEALFIAACYPKG